MTPFRTKMMQPTLVKLKLIEIISIEWYVPHYTPSTTQQARLS